MDVEFKGKEMLTVRLEWIGTENFQAAKPQKRCPIGGFSGCPD